MTCAILADSINFQIDAQSATQLATHLQLPLTPIISEKFTIYLLTDGLRIRLLMPSLAKTPYEVNFDTIALQKRLKTLRKELLIRACGIQKGSALTIVDATAGFGRDAFLLASAGAHVTLIEKNSIVQCLLANGISQLPETYQTRFLLCQGNSIEILPQIKTSIDVIYLDPMFEIDRRAKVKKDLQLLQALAKKDGVDNHALFAVAKKIAKQRVVVKRALHADYLTNEKPSFSLKGKDTRFDVYSYLEARDGIHSSKIC